MKKTIKTILFSMLLIFSVSATAQATEENQAVEIESVDMTTASEYGTQITLGEGIFRFELFYTGTGNAPVIRLMTGEQIFSSTNPETELSAGTMMARNAVSLSDTAEFKMSVIYFKVAQPGQYTLNINWDSTISDIFLVQTDVPSGYEVLNTSSEGRLYPISALLYGSKNYAAQEIWKIVDKKDVISIKPSQNDQIQGQIIEEPEPDYTFLYILAGLVLCVIIFFIIRMCVNKHRAKKAMRKHKIAKRADEEFEEKKKRINDNLDEFYEKLEGDYSDDIIIDNFSNSSFSDEMVTGHKEEYAAPVNETAYQNNEQKYQDNQVYQTNEEYAQIQEYTQNAYITQETPIQYQETAVISQEDIHYESPIYEIDQTDQWAEDNDNTGFIDWMNTDDIPEYTWLQKESGSTDGFI